MAQPIPPDDYNSQTRDMAADLRACVTSLANAVFKEVSKETARHGLAPLELALLRHCLEMDREVTATELARVMPVDASRISRMVTTLFDMGLLSRRRLREDRRVVMLSLTKEGRELTSQVLHDMMLRDAMLTEGIDEEEMRSFISITRKVIANHSAIEQTEE